MHIKQRIHARKLVLAYFYRHWFLFSIEKNNKAAIVEVNKVAEDVEREDQSVDDLFTQIQTFANRIKDMDPVEKAKYLADYCFDNRWWDNIDMEYAFALITEYDNFKDKVEEHVNKYTTSFAFDQMDLIDQSVFILGYIEYSKLKTPKEILLNEMIELSKRYGDDGSWKLLNGIMHHIIEELDKTQEA